MATIRELQAAEREQLARKIALESAFTPTMRRLINKMADDLATAYKNSGVLLNAADFANDFERELIKHYEKVTKKFTAFINVRLDGDPAKDGVARAFNNFAAKRGKSIEDAKKLVKQKQAEKLDVFIKQSAKSSTGVITNTNNREMRKAIERAADKVVSAGLPVNNKTVGDALADTFKESNGYRAAMISQVETQKAAEGAKAEAADAINETITGAEAGFIPVYLKEWITVGDDKVREAHAEADGQQVEVDQPFIVMGEELMWPSDESMGASPENTINCRCSSQYVENPDFNN
jgi:uncharacterized protein with gpF-like domain